MTAVLNSHLTNKSYLVGEELTVADVAMSLLLAVHNTIADTSLPHLYRWQSHVKAVIPSPKKSGAPAVRPPKKGSSTALSQTKTLDEGGVCPPLEDAVEGQVCTRFPPEPSGYLHIGHAKAVLLNQYYAQRYSGKLLVRFDDTNPSKEKEEFEENILADLATLQVKPDSVSHTSDHFAKCEELARKMIIEGKAYMDDTDQETMQAERMTHTESKRRDASVESNLAIFEQLLKGDKGEPCAITFCLRYTSLHFTLLYFPYTNICIKCVLY